MSLIRKSKVTALSIFIAGIGIVPTLALEVTDLERSPTVFSYYALGHLVPTEGGTGPNVNPRYVANPNIRLPIDINPAGGEHMYCNSQIFGYGGNGWGGQHRLPGTSSNDVKNYQFPWTTNICEIRGHKDAPSVCPTKDIHQGQDCRPPKPQARTYAGVALEKGRSHFQGGKSNVVQLTGESGIIWNYLHMEDILPNGDKTKGAALGKISNYFEASGSLHATSIHLHIEAKVAIPTGYRHVDPLPSLIVAYQRAIGNSFAVDGNGMLQFDPRFEIQQGAGSVGQTGPIASTSCAGDAEPSIGTEATNSFSSLWCHNGSVVGLVKAGGVRKFVYYKPRRGLADVVRENPVLFDGVSNNTSYAGRARHYSSRCGDQLFDAQGPVAPNFQFVRVSGTRKVFPHPNNPDGTPNCTPEFVQESLEFSYVSEFGTGTVGPVQPPPSDTASAQPDQLSANCSEVVLAPMPQSVFGQTFDNYWFHNCSIVGLRKSAAGDRSMVYVRPRADLSEAVDRETVLFRGRVVSSQYQGEAIQYNKQCGDNFFAAAGPIAANALSVDVTGKRPRFNVANGLCTPIAPAETCLRFSYAGETLAAALTKPLDGQSCATGDIVGEATLGDGTLNLSLDCRPKSICSNNFAALTPKAEPVDYVAKGYGYLPAWPGFQINNDFRDSNGFVIPGFGTRVAGSGIWWYWIRKRAGFEANGSPTFRELAKLFAGINDDDAPQVRTYAEAYKTHSIHYFGRRIGIDEPISLANPDMRWFLAQTMFHHEAGRKVLEVSRMTFDRGIELAEPIVQGSR